MVSLSGMPIMDNLFLQCVNVPPIFKYKNGHNKKMNIKQTDNGIEFIIASAVPDENDKLLFYLTDIEEKCINDLPYKLGMLENRKVALFTTGIGSYSVAATASLIIHTLQPKYAIFTGMAGAVDTRLKFGDLVIGSHIFGDESLSQQRDHNYWPSPVNNQILPLTYLANSTLLSAANKIKKDFDFSVHEGTVTSNDYFPFPPWFAEIYKEKRVLSIDLESAPFAHVCWLFSIPFIVVRSISNSVDSDSHVEFDDAVMSRPTTNAAAFVAKLIKCLEVMPDLKIPNSKT